MAKAVIFDIGGVLIDWQPRYLFEAHFPGDVPAMLAFFAEVLREIALKTCEAPFAEVMPAAKARHPEHAHLLEVFEREWFGFMRGPIADTVALLLALKAAGVPLYGLTNWPAETFPPPGPDYQFLEHLDEVVVSGEVRMRKPDPAIYRLALERFDLAPEDALFVDDLSENVAAARDIGIRGHHFQDAKALEAELKTLGLL